MPSDRGLTVTVGIGAAVVGLISFRTLSIVPALVSVALAITMLAIAAVDARSFRIPDVLSLPAIPAGLLASGSLLNADVAAIADLAHVLAAIAGPALFLALREGYWRLRGREGLGLGDVKLAAVAGAWTGPQGLIDVILLGSIAALVLVLVGAALRRDRSGIGAATRLPFGITLAPAIWLVWWLMATGIRS